MLQSSNHVTDQHPIRQEAKDPNNNIPLYTSDRIYVEMASLLKSSQVFGTKNSPSPRNTLDGFAHPLELCNYIMIIIISRGLIELTCATR